MEPQAPAIAGAVAQPQTGTANLSPFPSISVSDPTTPAQTLTVTIQLDAPGKVSLVSTYEPGSGGPADGASFSLPAIPGRRYIVKKSTNLLDCYTMAEVIPLTTWGQVAFPPTHEPKHFYRVALSPRIDGSPPPRADMDRRTAGASTGRPRGFAPRLAGSHPA